MLEPHRRFNLAPSCPPLANVRSSQAFLPRQSGSGYEPASGVYESITSQTICRLQPVGGISEAPYITIATKKPKFTSSEVCPQGFGLRKCFLRTELPKSMVHAVFSSHGGSSHPNEISCHFQRWVSWCKLKYPWCFFFFFQRTEKIIKWFSFF